jgi:hypothetical protein
VEALKVEVLTRRAVPFPATESEIRGRHALTGGSQVTDDSSRC